MKVIIFQEESFGYFVSWAHCGHNLAFGSGENLMISVFVPRPSSERSFMIIYVVMKPNKWDFENKEGPEFFAIQTISYQ